MDLTDQLEKLSLAEGADFFGVADLSKVKGNELIPGKHYLQVYPRAVALGITLIHDLVDALPRRLQESEVALNYRYHAYDVVNLRLDLLASNLASFLQKQGYRALPIPSSQRVDESRFRGAFSHKLTANLAGLGWIGRSCLLITPQAGPRVRWITIFTDAPLRAEKEPLANGCGECHACVDICPAHAITGRLFDENEGRELRLSAEDCDRYIREMEKITGKLVCGMCLYACPHGRNASRKLKSLE